MRYYKFNDFIKSTLPETIQLQFVKIFFEIHQKMTCRSHRVFRYRTHRVSMCRSHRVITEAKHTYTFALNSRATGKIKQNYSFISGRAHRNLKIKTLRVSQSIYKLLKKVWNITFALIFYTYFFIIFTWVLHFLKGCSFPYILQKTAWKSIRGDQNYSLSNAAGVKIKSCRNSISRKLNCIDCIELKKGVKCAVRLDQCWFLQLLILTPPLFNNVYLNNPSVDF